MVVGLEAKKAMRVGPEEHEYYLTWRLTREGTGVSSGKAGLTQMGVEQLLLMAKRTGNSGVPSLKCHQDLASSAISIYGPPPPPPLAPINALTADALQRWEFNVHHNSATHRM